MLFKTTKGVFCILTLRAVHSFLLPPLSKLQTHHHLKDFSSSSSSSKSIPRYATSLQPSSGPELAYDEQGRQRLPWKEDGYDFWEWKGHKIHFVALESEEARAQSKPPIVLIHGFGASVFHWRYNVPELAKTHRVYALDLLGFGLSDKPLTDYSAELWRDQLAAFLQEIVGVSGPMGRAKAIVVGNSLGGYTALATSAYHPDLVKACAVLNGAGAFDPPAEIVAAAASAAMGKKPKTVAEKTWIEQIKESVGQAARRVILYSAFFYTKQPARIKQVLQQVYVDKGNVDDELVESIRFPSTHQNAAEVFYRVVTRTSTAGSLASINRLLEMLSGPQTPLLLLWGDKDPWIGPRTADRIMNLYPSATKVSLDAGHCPHDEVPELVNQELINWVESLL